METIGKKYKQAINDNFRHTLIERNVDGYAAALNGNVKDSVTMHILPRVETIKLEKIDDLHDKLSLSWLDYKVEGVVTYKPSVDPRKTAMVFCGIE